MKEYFHKKPGEDTQAQPWSCKVIEEGRIFCGNREYLYIIGEAAVGSSCVGAGTLRYIHVPGYIAQWHCRTDAEGTPVSSVEPVTDDESRAAIRRVLSEKYSSLQVCF